METNGIANIHIRLDMALSDGTIQKSVADDIRKQLDFLERYMFAHGEIADAHKAGLEYFQGPFEKGKGEGPFWHDIIRNPEKYPTLREAKINELQIRGSFLKK